METTKQRTVKVLEMKILSAKLGCAEEKLRKDSELIFRLIIEKKNAIENISEKRFSKKVTLSSSLMNFEEDLIIFPGVDFANDYLELTMGIGNSEKGHKFPSNTINLQQINVKNDKEVIVSWKLNLNSVVNVKYRVYEEIEGKLQIGKRSSTKTPAAVNMSSVNTLDSAENDTINLNEEAKENAPNNIKRKSIYESSNSRSLSVLPSSDNNTNKLKQDKRESTGVKGLISFFDKKATNVPLNKIPNIKTTSNNADSRISFSSAVTNYTLEKPIEDKSVFQEKENCINMHSNIDCIQTARNMTTIADNDNSLNLINSRKFTIPDKAEDVPDSFCEAFFIAGLPYTDVKAIDDSEDYLAPCQHSNCSMLPAYKPEIITRYPLKDSSRLELNSLLASLCFPLGIKLCYALKDSLVKTVKNYSTSIINQDGSRYYLMTYCIFVRNDNYLFQKNSKINPVKEFLHLEKILPLLEGNAALKKKIEMKLEKQLEICTQFNFNETVYVPYSVCLISKCPYLKQMERCLQRIVKMLVDEKANEDDILKLVLHLTREVPIPPLNKKSSFFLPDVKTPVEITAQTYQNIPILNNNISRLLDIFSIENIIIIHHLILLEQKILFVGDEYCQLSEIIESFVCLLYPMQWTHTYIPILSEEMIKYLQSFMPFIMGIDQSLLDHAKPYLAEEDSIYVIYIKKDLIVLSSDKKGKKLKKKELLTIPEYPIELEKSLAKKLTEIKKVIDKSKSKKGEINDTAVEMCIRDIFVKVFVKMIGDFNKYSALIDDVPLFNTESFLKNRPEKDSQFYSEFTDTQLFRTFLQSNTKECFPYFYSEMENHFQTISDQKETSRRSISSSGRKSIANIKKESDYKDMILNSKINNTKVDLNNITNFNDAASTLSTINSFENLNLLERIATFDTAEAYLLSPYFITEPLTGCEDLSDITKLIKGEDQVILSEKERVFSSFKMLNLGNIPNKCNRFELPESKRQSTNANKPVVSSSFLSKISALEQKVEQAKKNRMFLKGSQKKGEQLTPGEEEEVKNIINESLRMIFTSEKLSLDTKKTMDSIFKKSFGREHFTKGVYQAKFKENKEHCLTKEGFDDLFALIFQALLVEGEDNLATFKQVRLLTKSTFYYFKSVGKNNYYINQELKSKKGTFSIWKNEKFWMNWFDEEKKEIREEKKFSDENEVNFNILLDIARIMDQINIEGKFILNCVVDYLGKTIIKSEKLLNELNLVILKQTKNINELYFH